MSKRLLAMGAYRYRNGFQLTLHPQALSEPYKWKKPRLVFVNSMSDLFHKDVPLEFIKSVFRVMNECDRHQFQVLTKRSERLSEIARHLNWTPNIWMGVSVENEKYSSRIDDLRKVPAAIRFLSIEPLLGPLPKMNLKGIHWVIVGGESGPGARTLQSEWVRDIRNQCKTKKVAFFFKQWGGVRKNRTGRLLDRREWNEMPKIRPSIRESNATV